MSRLPSKRHSVCKALALIVLIGVGHYLQSHPMEQQAMVETAAPLTDLG